MGEKTSRRTWAALIVAWIAMAGSQVITFSYGMMLKDVMVDFGMDYDVAGLIGSVSGIVSVLVTIPVALIAGRFPAKFTVPVCAAAVAAGMLCFGQATSIPMLYVGRILSTIFYNGITTSLVVVKMRQVPRHQISGVNGIENFMQPIGQTVATLCMAQLLTAVGGWRNVYTIIGCVLLAMALLWLVFYKDTAPAASPQTQEDGPNPLIAALKQKSFWIIILAWPFTVLIWIGMFFYWPSYAQNQLNFTAAQSGLVVGLIPIFSCIASLTAPSLAKKIGYDKLLIWPWGFILPILYYMMLQTDNMVLLCLFSALAGYGAYCYVPLLFTTMYKLGLPPKVVSIGTAMGMTGIALGTAMGSGVIGYLIPVFGGDIRKALSVCCLSPIVFGILTLFLPERGRKALEKATKTEAK